MRKSRSTGGKHRFDLKKKKTLAFTFSKRKAKRLKKKIQILRSKSRENIRFGIIGDFDF